MLSLVLCYSVVLFNFGRGFFKVIVYPEDADVVRVPVYLFRRLYELG